MKLKPGDVCRRLQDTLAEQGSAALRDDQAAQRHLEECGECFGVLEALRTLDQGFDAMAPLNAPDEVVESLLARDELRTTETPEPVEEAPRAAVGWRQLFAPPRPKLQAAAAFVMLAIISLPAYLYFQQRRLDAVRVTARAASDEQLRAISVIGDSLDASDEDRAQEGAEQELERLEALGYVGAVGPKKTEAQPEPTAQGGGRQYSGSRRSAGDGKEGLRWVPAPEDSAAYGSFSGEMAPGAQPAPLDDSELRDLELRGAYDLPIWVGTQADITFRGGSPRVESDVEGPFDEDSDARQRVRDRLRERLRKLPRGLQEETVEVTAEAPEIVVQTKSGSVAVHGVVVPDTHTDASPGELARRFLAERDAVDVPSKPATGYWANTYVPGDPALRFLQARLAGRDAASLALAEAPPRPHDAARQVSQPFDPPPDAAMAVQLHADRAAIEGETRLLVQVGLAGTPRRGGRRPAMNVALVLDPTGATPETGAAMVALAGAFAEAHDSGDRFRLIAAGHAGELVTPENPRRGAAVVAVRDLLAAGATAPGATASGGDLATAVRLAIEKVAGGDDPTAPLGSSAVIVATSRPLGTTSDELTELVDLAHDTGLAGIPLSVIGVGGAVDLAELDELALAGQGSRRLLATQAEARALIDRELAAAGRAVARAVRLTVTLAPAARLVDVVGSHRHGSEAVDWVRGTERAIDQRLARNLGIAADRGDDDAGVQIVIPTFYAGDRHAVLLDVVAPGPGPVADVTVRYKDLVRVENAVVRQRLELPRGEPSRGPLELNVLENLLAYRLRDALKTAGDSLAKGDAQAVALRLEEHRRLLAGLGSEVAGLARSPDLGRDLAMLDEYLDLLGGGWPATPERVSYLADSLRYAARLKILPVPEPLGGAS